MSAQAVGGAVGWNPICIIIPCHRVVGTNGSLTGYSGGIKNKIELLKLEGNDISKYHVSKRGTINNSKIFKKIQNEYGTFHNYLKTFTNDVIIYEIDKTTNQLSDDLSKDLQKRGMKFVGSTIIYSYLQAIGIIYSHDKECFMYKNN